MSSFFGRIKIELCAAEDNLVTMLDIVVHHLLEIEYPRHSIHQRKHDHTEGILHRGMLVKIVEHHLRNSIPLQFNHQSHTVAIRLITNIGNTFQLFIVYQFNDFLNQPYLVDLIRKFCDNNGLSAIFLGNLDNGPCTNNHLAPAGQVGRTDTLVTIDNAASRKIRSNHIFHEIGNFKLRIGNQGYHAVHNLPEVLGWNIGCHTDSNT